MNQSPSVYAAALARAAHESGRAARERETVAVWDAMARTQIPRRALSFVLSGQADRSEHAIQVADAWALEERKQPTGGIYVLAGPVGTGKTVAAAWWACRVRAEWASASMLGLAPHVEASRELARLRKAPALVLDDLGGQGTTSPHAVSRLATLIRERHADMLATVITTNLSPSAFADVYDGVDDPASSRLLDRVRESGAWEPVLGGSMRKGGPAPEASRVELARTFCRTLEAVEEVAHGREPVGGELAQLRALLNLDGDQVAALVADVRASKVRTDALVSGLLDRVRVSQRVGGQLDEEARREELRRQVAALGAGGDDQ